MIAAIVAATFGAPPVGAPLPALKHPIAVMAHRGGAGLAPENTLAAFRNAIRLGVDYVEVDVRETNDGELVLMHDRTVDRTTNGKGAVEALSLAEIRSLDAGASFSPKSHGEHVPTFAEALSLCRGRVNIYLDHKSGPVAKVLAAVRSARMERHVLVYAGTECLQEWKRLAPEIPVMPSLPDELRRPGGPAEYLKTLRVEALDGHIVEWSRELVAEAHAAGVRVYVDNLTVCDDPAGYARALEAGVDGIQSDYPDRLIRWLAGRKRGAGR